jgi:2-polyprenyl-3-methyl-5-hydroxy-6-metoxy-1,4-benzoquinol methylase
MTNDKIDRSETYRINLNLADDNDVRIIGYSFIKPESVVLDVGCACGDFGILLKKNKNCTLHGFEYNEGSIQIARNAKIYELIHQIDLNTFSLNNYSDYLGKFDYIIVLDVLEHLYDPETVLKKLKLFLKPKGHLILSLPNIAHGSIIESLLQNDFTYTEMGILDKTHVKFFTYKTISEMLSICGFEINVVDARIAGISEKNKIPGFVKRYIMRSVYSYVVQYIAMIHISDKNVADLKKINIHNFSLKSDRIKKRLHAIKVQILKEYFIPYTSYRYKFLKRMKCMLANTKLKKKY